MPGRRGWSSRNREAASPPLLDFASDAQRRAAARTVAAASTDLDDLRELLAMLGLDQPTATTTDSSALPELD